MVLRNISCGGLLLPRGMRPDLRDGLGGARKPSGRVCMHIVYLYLSLSISLSLYIYIYIHTYTCIPIMHIIFL